jgi:hypothetical protein
LGEITINFDLEIYFYENEENGKKVFQIAEDAIWGR